MLLYGLQFTNKYLLLPNVPIKLSIMELVLELVNVSPYTATTPKATA